MTVHLYTDLGGAPACEIAGREAYAGTLDMNLLDIGFGCASLDEADVACRRYCPLRTPTCRRWKGVTRDLRDLSVERNAAD